MKKMMTLIICAVVALSITACASSGTAAKTPITETTAITEATAITETTAITEITAIPKSTTPANTNPDTMIANPSWIARLWRLPPRWLDLSFARRNRWKASQKKRYRLWIRDDPGYLFSGWKSDFWSVRHPGNKEYKWGIITTIRKKKPSRWMKGRWL